MLRAILEQTTGSWAFKRRLSIKGQRVPIVVSPAGGLRYLLKPINAADPLLVRMAEQYVRRGAVVWDVGANVGLFTFAAAALAGPSGSVIAFEPDAWLVQLLRRSARMQPKASASVTIIPAAVAKEPGLRSFSIAKRSRSSNHLSEYGETQAGGTKELQTVVAVSLDSCDLTPPNVLKIDVEGAELETLAGATRIIEQSRPVILSEVSEHNRPAATEFLKERGYRLINGETGEEGSAAWTTIAIPS